MRNLLPLLAFAAGCQRDPTFFGYWDIVEVERDGVVQDDVGFFEVNDDTSVTVFVRYTWDGDGFVPDPAPRTETGDTEEARQEFFGNYQTKGEEHFLLLPPFDANFFVEEYFGDRATLTSDAASWPRLETDQLLPTTLFVRR
jgi:hypothetical protein